MLTVAVPVIVGVAVLALSASTVGVAGGVVSITSSSTVTSDEALPAASVLVTKTLLAPFTSGAKLPLSGVAVAVSILQLPPAVAVVE